MKVYWAINKPMKNTYHLELNPERLTNLVKTNEAEAWWLGTKMSTMAMIATPRMCHQAETSDRNATTRTPKVFRRPWMMRMPGIDDEDPAGRGREVEDHVEERREEEGEPVVDAGGDRHLAEEVEPACEPAPGAGVLPCDSLADQ